MTEHMELEKTIQYSFSDPELLQTALTHSSFSRENAGTTCNERLEFIGDAFFDAIIGEKLFELFPEKEEGFLSRVRASLVCEKSLAQIARKLDLGSCLRLGHGEEKAHGREKESILADAMEAVIGAIYMDGGFETVQDVVLRLFAQPIEEARKGHYIITDYKTALQEKLQAQGSVEIRYELIGESGPDHDKTFHTQVVVNGKPQTKGTGKNKKQAEQDAARQLLERNADVL